MIPTNKRNKNCAVTSSGCVIWDGPDIPCINICKGDSVSEVTYKLAQVVCSLQEQMDISVLNLDCLNLPSCDTPEDLMDVLQIIVDRICELSNLEPAPIEDGGGCPTDCIVSIPECFWYTDPTGVQVTTMPLMDFITAIANRSCNSGAQIRTIDKNVTDLDFRVQALEDKPEPIFVLPEITPKYVLPRVPTPMDEVLIATEEQFGALRESTGNIQEIYNAISKMPVGLSDSPRLAGIGNMATIEGWRRENDKLTDSINNIWLAIADLRAAVANIKQNCCGSGCDGIDIVLQTTLTATQLRIFLNGSVPSGMADCHLEGALFRVEDTNGAFTEFRVPILSILNNSGGYLIDLANTPVDANIDIAITGFLCLKNEGTGEECQTVVSDFKNIVETCPNLSFSETLDSISYSGTWSGQTATVTVEIWEADESTMVAANSATLSNGGNISGEFSNLTSATDYRIRIKITKNGKDQYCPFVTITTLTPACDAPEDVTPEIL